MRVSGLHVGCSRPYVRTAEAAEFLCRTPQTLAWWAHAGKGPRFVGGGRGNPRLYRVSELERWLEEGDE